MQICKDPEDGRGERENTGGGGCKGMTTDLPPSN